MQKTIIWTVWSFSFGLNYTPMESWNKKYSLLVHWKQQLYESLSVSTLNYRRIFKRRDGSFQQLTKAVSSFVFLFALVLKSQSMFRLIFCLSHSCEPPIWMKISLSKSYEWKEREKKVICHLRKLAVFWIYLYVKLIFVHNQRDHINSGDQLGIFI